MSARDELFAAAAGQRRPRQNLADVLPLYGPYKLFVESTRLCNFSCRCCPTGRGLSVRPAKGDAVFMDLALARRMEANIRESGWKVRRTHMYLLGEPLMHPQFTELCTIFAKPHMGYMDTRTNGALLSRVNTEALCYCGLNEICVSVEGVGEGAYEERSGHRSYELVRSNVALLRAMRDREHSQMKIKAKLVYQGETEEELARFARDFEAADERIMEYAHNWSAAPANRFVAGEVEAGPRQGQELGERLVCPSPFFAMAVSWSGHALCCFVDHQHATEVGDLNAESLMDVWRGPRMAEFRRMQLAGQRESNSACRDCDYVRQVIDSLDADAERLTRCYPKEGWRT
jgi:MoaA/NifB/PqqE/SkfB family radical SAM enzyme